jgi:chorismate mutase
MPVESWICVSGGIKVNQTDAIADLERMRSNLDQIDDQLLRTVRDRINLVVRIGKHKSDNDIPVMQHARVSAVHDRVAAFAADNGLDGDFLRRLYELLIDEACRLEDEVVGNATNGQQSSPLS